MKITRIVFQEGLEQILTIETEERFEGFGILRFCHVCGRMYSKIATFNPTGPARFYGFGGQCKDCPDTTKLGQYLPGSIWPNKPWWTYEVWKNELLLLIDEQLNKREKK
jgi:hypothetical protein